MQTDVKERETTTLVSSSSTGAMTLWEAEEFLTAAIDTEGVVDDADADELKLVVQAALQQAVGKREAVAQFILQCEDREAFCRREVQRIQKRAQVFANVAKRVRTYVADLIVGLPMVTKGKKTSFAKLEGSTCTMSVRSNPASLTIDEALIPFEYKRISVSMKATEWELIAELFKESPHERHFSVDHKAVKEALAKGEADAAAKGELFAGIPGAKLESGDVSLRIS